MKTINLALIGALSRARRTAPWLALLVAAVSGAAQGNGMPTPDAVALAHLDGFALGLEHAGAFSGVVLVAKNGEIVMQKAYGKADEMAEGIRDSRITVDTRFNLASAGKMFTAVAILQQVAAGRLTLDTLVGEVLADYPNRSLASRATVRHLLTHTAGAGDIDLFGAENAETRSRVRSVADMVALHHRRAPAFEPGSEQAYGNFGHVLLGRMVEVLSGEDFETYLARHVFEPAGMQRTGFFDCDDGAADIAVGYATVDGHRVSNCKTQPTRGFPAGGQLSTAADMHRFVVALQRGLLLDQALFADAVRPHREYMGLGFFATGYGPGIPASDFRWGHGGSSDGVCTDIRTYPATGDTVIVLSNHDAPGCFAIANVFRRQW